MPDQQTKICSNPKCGKEKPLSEFYFIKKTGKYRGQCRDCIAEKKKVYNSLHKEERKEYDRQKYLNNRDKNLESAKEYRKLHKEEINRKAKIYRSLNKDKISISNKIYRDKNKNELNRKKREHYAYNKIAISLRRKILYLKNIDKILARGRLYYSKNREHLSNKSIKYYHSNRDARIIYAKTYYNTNKLKYNELNRLYYINNKQKISDRKKRIRLTTTDHSLENARARKWRKHKLLTDVVFKLRCYVSNGIRAALKSNGSSKFGQSILDHLPYVFLSLKLHIENQFVEHMTWDNWGLYDPKTHREDDPSTWTWQLDHIIPQSDLPYTSMEDENFKKCWALENLRPLWSKQNIIDGANRIRHKDKKR